jgi:putative aldouronate transport system substrate-binding protein
MIKIKWVKGTAVLAISFVLVMTGCSNKTTVNPNANKSVELKWVLLGDKQADSDEVWAKYNEQLDKALPGTKVNFEMIPGSNYKDKWKMMASSGETVDIAWNGYMQQFVMEAKSGMYMPLDDLIDKNAPDIRNEIPDWVFQKARVDGKIYSIPNYQMMTNNRTGFVTQKENADKYLDKDKMIKAFTSTETTTKEQYKMLEDYMKVLKDNGNLKLGLGPTAYIQLKGYEQVVSNVYIKRSGADYKLYDLVDIPEVKEFIFVMKDWYDKGYIRKDTLTAKDDAGKYPQKFYSVWMTGNYLDISTELSSKKDEIPLQYLPIEKNFYIGNGPSSTASVIPVSCKNPERAIKVLELMNTKKGKDIYNTLVYGIEGKHYTKVNDTRIETKFDIRNASKAPYSIAKWILGNTFNAYETQYDTDGYMDYIKNDVNGKAVRSPILGFRADLTNITNEISQSDAILNEYLTPLYSGGIGNDTEKMYDEFVKKIKKSGSDKVIAELQKQIDEWAKNKK